MGEELNGYVDFVGDFERPEHYYETSGKEIAQLLAEELPRLGINILSVQPFGDCYRIRCVCSRSHFELAVSITHHDETGKRWSILADAERSFFWRA